MQAIKDPRHLKILHVLSLNGRNGEYGGPVRVARELCTELNSRGHTTVIFSGALLGSAPNPKKGLVESFVSVKPISKKLAVSSLWSWKLVKPLNQLIKESDVIHIHFARDLIPFLAACLAILRRKPFVTQTHGMIVLDGRLSVRITDFLLTKPLINRSKTNLVLTQFELNAVKKLGLKSPARIIPNGIAVEKLIDKKPKNSKRILFCSRLDKRKGIDKFIELADFFKHSEFIFEIFGPDGGELDFVLKEISDRKLDDKVFYKGAVEAHEVQDQLFEANLLILPSKDEPFPMIVLESLAVGTPVLVMPSCGFSETLRNFEPNFVACSEDLNGLKIAFESISAGSKNPREALDIQNFCANSFGISAVTDAVILTYVGATGYAS
jgi:glycosyltransferase involved in cell wall biosynthesis